MVAYVFSVYGSNLSRHRQVRKAALLFTLTAFFAASVAGIFGALINKKAPIQGGPVPGIDGGTKVSIAGRRDEVNVGNPKWQGRCRNSVGWVWVVFRWRFPDYWETLFPTIARFFNFYKPTGPLSGVTTTAIIIWLILWMILLSLLEKTERR